MDAGSQNFGRPETRLNEESAAGTLGCVVALQGTPAPIEQVARAAGIGQAKVAASGVGAQPDAAPGCVAPWTRVRGFGPGQFDGCGRSGVVDGRSDNAGPGRGPSGCLRCCSASERAWVALARRAPRPAGITTLGAAASPGVRLDGAIGVRGVRSAGCLHLAAGTAPRRVNQPGRARIAARAPT